MTAHREDLDTPLIVVVGILFAILTFVVIVLLQAWFYRIQAEEHHAKSVAPRSDELTRAVADQEADLHRYRWLDRDEGLVGIPIERAMELLVREAAEAETP
jgi:hypothetical protein